MSGKWANVIVTVAAVLISASSLYSQEYSAGVNTSSPNPNAVLHLVSPNGDQGLLIPQLTTSQRTQMSLSVDENGLLVYDVTEGLFYYWHETSWNPLGTASAPEENNTDQIQVLSKEGNVVSLSKSGGSFTDEVEDADSDPENELQGISKTGNLIQLSDGGQINITETTPEVGQIIQWNGKNWVAITPEQAQNLSFESNTLSISGGNSIDLSVLADSDGDPLNEIQALSLDADVLSISGSISSIDLTPYKGLLTEEQVDAYVSNNGYVESESDPTVPENLKDGVDWSEISGIPAGFADEVDAVNDADSDPSNEIQDLSLLGDRLTITNNSGATSIDLTPYLDNTDQQTLDFTNGVITLSGDPNATSIDLNDFDDNANDDFDGLFSSLNGVPADLADGDDVDDADSDPANEIQDLSLSGDDLQITNNTSASTIDLSKYLDNTDEQDLSLSGNSLNLSGDGSPVDLTPYLDNTDEQDLSLSGNTLSLSGDASSVDLSGYLDNTDEQAISLSGNTLNISGNASAVDLSSYLDNTDEQALSLSGNTLSITGNSAIIDLSGYLDNTDEQSLDFTGSVLTLSGDPNSTSIDLSDYDTNVNDDFDGSWNSLNDRPSDFIDGAIDWSEIENIPSVFLDGIDNTLSSADVRIYALADNQLKQELSFNSGIISLTGSSTSINLSTWDEDIDETNELITEMYVAANDSLYIIEGGQISATDIRTSASDERLKKEITPIEDALERLQKIGGYNYYLKSDSLNQNLKTGVIAQQVESVFPSIVKRRKDGYLGVTYQELIPILIEALKEQQQMIENLSGEVDVLKSSDSQQDDQIAALQEQLDIIMSLMTK